MPFHFLHPFAVGQVARGLVEHGAQRIQHAGGLAAQGRAQNVAVSLELGQGEARQAADRTRLAGEGQASQASKRRQQQQQHVVARVTRQHEVIGPPQGAQELVKPVLADAERGQECHRWKDAQ